jgi:Predicted membrane protein
MSELESQNKSKNRPISHVLTARQQVYSSPLPPPEALEKYEQIQSGLVQTIIAMTEAQGNHRRELEKKHLEAQIRHQKSRDGEAKLGQVFAFLIAVLAISGGLYTALQGHQVAGSIISLIGLSGLVTPFIIGR